jgi:long-chain acyl-CoA synthetase
MSHAWLQHYPEIVKPTIELSEGTHIASLIEDTCQKYSSKIALTCMGADLSFRQFDRLANDFASYLQNEVGLRKGDRFATALPSCCPMFFNFLLHFMLRPKSALSA